MKDNKTKLRLISRYGKFYLKAYSWFLSTVSILLIFFVIFKREILIFAIIVELIVISDCFLTHYEKYNLYENTIIAKKIFTKKSILLPKNIILIVAKTDLLSWNSLRLKASRKNVVEYDDRYMICIVSNCSVDETIKVIHQCGFQKDEQYYNEVIRDAFKKTVYHDFLYSFVYDKDQVQKLVENHNCQIIVPKSLEGKVDLSGINIPIHIDEEG